MAKKLHKPTLEALQALKVEATNNGKTSEGEWSKKLCATLAGLIKQEPLRYRAYGPFWWALKRIMLDNGIQYFGDHIDAEGFEMVDYGNPTFNLLAAWSYGEYATDLGLMLSNQHNIEIISEDSEEPKIEVYTLTDDEVESLAWR